MTRFAMLCILLGTLAGAEQNWASHALGGRVTGAPPSLSPAHGPELLLDGAPLGPPYESVPGQSWPQTLAFRFAADRAVLVQRVTLHLATVGRDRRPSRIEVYGSLFGAGMFGYAVEADSLLLRIGELRIGPRADRAVLELPEALPLRRVLLRVVEASGESFALSEVEIWGEASPRGEDAPAPSPLQLQTLRDQAALAQAAASAPPSAAEMRLFDAAEEGARLDPVEAALIASGDVGEAALGASLVRFDDIFALVPRDRFEKQLAGDRARALLRWLHDTVLVGFVDDAADLRKTLEAYRYEDVTATVLYTFIATSLGLQTRAVETSSHVYAEVLTDDGWLPVETTWRRGVDPSAEERAAIAEARGFEAGDLRRALPPFGLAAHLYAARARRDLAAGRFPAALAAARGAVRCDSGSARAFSLLLEVCVAWSHALARASHYADALALVRAARAVAPVDSELFAQELTVYGLWSQELLSLTRHAEAVAVLEEALAAGVAGRPLLELYLAEAYGRWALWTFETAGRTGLPDALAVLEPAARRLGENPTLELYAGRIRASWADAPLLGTGSPHERRAACLERYASLLDARPESLLLRRRLAGHAAAWALAERESLPPLKVGATAVERERFRVGAARALGWLDQALALLGANASLTERRAALARELAETLIESDPAAIFSALALFADRSSPAALAVAERWAREPWSEASALLDFRRLDADSNGVLNKREWRAGMPPFTAVDSEEDGRVVRAEADAWLDASGARSLARFASASGRPEVGPGLRQRWQAFALELADALAGLGDPLRAAEVLEATAQEAGAVEDLTDARDRHLATWVRGPMEAPEPDYVLAEVRLLDALRRFPEADGLALTYEQLYLEWTAFDVAAERTAKALETLESALERQPGSAPLQRRLRQLYYQRAEALGRNDPLAGAEVYSRALAFDPAEENFAVNRAFLWRRWAEKPYAQDDVVGVIERYRQLLGDHPDDASLRTATAHFVDLVARSRMEVSDFDGALELYDAGLELLPEHPDLLRNRKHCLLRRP